MRQAKHQKPRRQTAKDRQAAATRARLLEAAQRLFNEHGYHAVSVTEIAREAGVSHGSIHAHFDAKAGLLYAVITQNNERQIAESKAVIATPGPVLERIGRIVGLWARWDLEDPDLLGVMQAYYWQWSDETEAHNRGMLAEAFAPVKQVLTEARNGGELSADLDLERTCRAIFALYTHALRPALYDGASSEACAREALAQIEMLLSGSCTVADS